MGYRLHYAQHYEPNWQGGYFNWRPDEFASMYYDNFSDNGWQSEDESQFEIFRGDIQKYIKKLKKLKPNGINRYFKSDEPYTNKEIIEVLSDILNSKDEHIRLEWY